MGKPSFKSLARRMARRLRREPLESRQIFDVLRVVINVSTARHEHRCRHYDNQTSDWLELDHDDVRPAGPDG